MSPSRITGRVGPQIKNLPQSGVVLPEGGGVAGPLVPVTSLIATAASPNGGGSAVSNTMTPAIPSTASKTTAITSTSQNSGSTASAPSGSTAQKLFRAFDGGTESATLILLVLGVVLFQFMVV
jgi:hypothetical protein